MIQKKKKKKGIILLWYFGYRKYLFFRYITNK